MPSSTLILLTTTVLTSFVVSPTKAYGSSYSTTPEEKQCKGYKPMESISTYLTMNLDYDLADRICCNNHVYAEPFGYHLQPQVNFYSKLNPDQETVFYDSVCGLPLFVAPRGRTFEEFVQESKKHGWPSFRPEELISENVIIHKDGRMESKCLTHLGHNLPEGGVDRYCIDLVCIAGDPSFLESKDTGAALIDHSEDVIESSELDLNTYDSSAENWSGKYPKTKERLITAAIVIVAVGTLIFLVVVIRKRMLKNKEEKEETKAMHSGKEEVFPIKIQSDTIA